MGNQFDDDRVLRSYLRRVLPNKMLGEIEDGLRDMGELSGGLLYELQQADQPQAPRLKQWDAWGNRVDEIQVTPLWREAEHLAAEHGIVATAYEQLHGRFSRIHQFALAYLFAPSSGFYTCPLAMADGAARAMLLSGSEELIESAVSRIASRNPDLFWTSGQWMTEHVGGSDVSRTETIARQDENETWRLYGRKWFTSAINAPMALTLARPEGNPDGNEGLALFYVKLRDEEGCLQNIRIDRLKDKLGTRKLPTAEITLEGTPATLVGDLENGIRQIAPMLNITRAWNAVCSVALMRRGIALARSYAEKRKVTGARLNQKPLHVDTLASMQSEYEGAFHLTFRVVELIGRLEEGGLSAEQKTLVQKLLRVLTSIAKLTTAKQAVAVTSEVLEAFGGAGYLEDTGLPTLLRDAQVLPIWEGTTNVLALDTLDALRDAGGLTVLKAEVQRCVKAVREPSLVEATKQAHQAMAYAAIWLREAQRKGPDAFEAGARRFALALGRTLELALLARHAQWSLDKENDGRAAAAARRFAAGTDPLAEISLDDSHVLATDEPMPVPPDGVDDSLNEAQEEKPIAQEG